jgi:hypothetical protein
MKGCRRVRRGLSGARGGARLHRPRSCLRATSPNAPQAAPALALPPQRKFARALELVGGPAGAAALRLEAERRQLGAVLAVGGQKGGKEGLGGGGGGTRLQAQARMASAPAQHSTAQHSTAQHSTAPHSTAQHRTARHAYSPTPLSPLPTSPTPLSPLAPLPSPFHPRQALCGDLPAAVAALKEGLASAPDDWAGLLLALDALLPATAAAQQEAQQRGGAAAGDGLGGRCWRPSHPLLRLSGGLAETRPVPALAVVAGGPCWMDGWAWAAGRRQCRGSGRRGLGPWLRVLLTRVRDTPPHPHLTLPYLALPHLPLPPPPPSTSPQPRGPGLRGG